MKIKKGDNIKIISGNDKGKEGKVLAVFPSRDRIVVDGSNMQKKHQRSRRQDKKGEIVHIPGTMMASRAMIVCPKCKKASRVKFIFNDMHKKMRICGSCESEL